jgi:hypothetical protein
MKLKSQGTQRRRLAKRINRNEYKFKKSNSSKKKKPLWKLYVLSAKQTKII